MKQVSDLYSARNQLHHSQQMFTYVITASWMKELTVTQQWRWALSCGLSPDIWGDSHMVTGLRLNKTFFFHYAMFTVVHLKCAQCSYRPMPQNVVEVVKLGERRTKILNCLNIMRQDAMLVVFHNDKLHGKNMQCHAQHSLLVGHHQANFM